MYTTIQKFGDRFFLFSKEALNWSKETVKSLKRLQKIYVLNKCCSFEQYILQRILKKITMV